MVIPAIGNLISVCFPFSDLSDAKLRPAVVLAPCGLGDWLVCQITSSTYGDPRGIFINTKDFVSGGLRTGSYARPTRLFTANESLFQRVWGDLKDETLRRTLDESIAFLSESLPETTD